MDDDSNVDFNDFQEKVLSEYGILKSIKSAENFNWDELIKSSKGSLRGWLFAPVLAIIIRYSRKKVAELPNKRKYDDFEKYAKTFISQNGINQAICNSIKNLGKHEILTEEKFIKLITGTLIENDLRARFAIPFEPTLFAFIAYIIFQKGLENYCEEL